MHAHVSDKPSSNRPAITAPSITAALQVQSKAHKQHQKRLQGLKAKLKKLRVRLEQLQTPSSKQDTITAEEEQEHANSEMDTLNDLKMATQDAIKELDNDYPHANTKPAGTKTGGEMTNELDILVPSVITESRSRNCRTLSKSISQVKRVNWLTEWMNFI